ARLEPGEAIAISTGAVVPDGADAVVPVELSELHDGALFVPRIALGVNVRPRGGDVRAGDLVVATGTRLRPAQVGALAACGVAVVRCARRPRVAVVPTGTELRRPGEQLAPGEIYESNSLLLAAQLRSAGAEPELFGAVADDPVETRAVRERGLLARRREAGQAPRVRDTPRDACVRPAGKPRLVTRCVRALRAAGRAC